MTFKAEHPREVIRVMAPQIQNLRLVIRHHFSRRHMPTHSPQGVRAWIKELRRVDRGSGYSQCVRQVGDSKYHAYRATAN